MMDPIRAELAALRKDIRHLRYVVVGTWMTTVLAIVLGWINLSGQIARLH